MVQDITLEQICRHEGLRLKPYRDTVGKLTIGIGRNLDDRGITKEEAKLLFLNDIRHTMHALDIEMKWWTNLDPVRQGVMLNMAFNMGVGGLAKFHRMKTALRNKNYGKAAMEMLDSKWAKQVGPRATELAKQMESGNYRV